MYIPEFLVGAIATIFAELTIGALCNLLSGHDDEEDDEGEE